MYTILGLLIVAIAVVSVALVFFANRCPACSRGTMKKTETDDFGVWYSCNNCNFTDWREE